jgi:hypothetical protein
MFVLPSNIVPPPSVPLRQIQFVVISTSAEGKLSHLARFDVIISLISSRVLINYAFFCLFALFDSFVSRSWLFFVFCAVSVMGHLAVGSAS